MTNTKKRSTKHYAKNKVSIILTEYNKDGTKRKRLRRGSAKIRHLLDTSNAERFKIKVIYFSNKEMTNESLIGSKEYVGKILSDFTAKDLVQSLE